MSQFTDPLADRLYSAADALFIWICQALVFTKGAAMSNLQGVENSGNISSVIYDQYWTKLRVKLMQVSEYVVAHVTNVPVLHLQANIIINDILMYVAS